MKNKEKAILKAQKKSIKTELSHKIADALHAVILNLSTGNKKVEKLINKNAKQLAKKLSKEKITIDEPKVESGKIKAESALMEAESEKPKAKKASAKN